MANVLASDLVKRKREIVFAEGYFIDCATELTGAIDAGQDVIHIYGQDSPILDTNVNNSTLTVTVFDKKENNVLLDVLQQDDPDDTTAKQYNWNNVYEVSVWANRKNTAGTQYTRSVFFKNWLPVPTPTATGDANTKGTRSLSGNAEAAKEFTQPIIGQKIALNSGAGITTFTGTLAYTPLQVPDESVYAIRVVAIEETRNGTHISNFNKEDLAITASMVAADKTVTIKQTDMNIVDIPNYAYVNYLYDKTSGVYPTLTGSGMFTTKC